MDYTSRLKLPRYAGTDAADLTRGYNVAADRLEAAGARLRKERHGRGLEDCRVGEK